MAKTAVGLFKNLDAANAVVRDLEAGGFLRKDIRVLGEPVDMAGSGVLSIPHTDFEVELARDLKALGAAEADVKAYLQGIRRGRVMVFATGSGAEADKAVVIMNRHQAVDVEKLRAMEHDLPGTDGDKVVLDAVGDFQPGNIPTSSGARLFSW